MKKPFLKWAGGKTRLCTQINNSLPEGKRLIEPFVGSGAVFMNTNYSEYLLSDTNADLINLYQHLKNEGEEFIEFSRQYFTPENNTPEVFYELRSVFNASKDSRLKSALFIYLNRHCFNGLCRYNSKGGFNVPFGRYSKPNYPEKEMRTFCEKSKIATFQIADFKETMSQAKKGDVIYCDPPYVPLTSTANFTDYSIGGFSMKDQKDLSDSAIRLKKRGVPVLISNHCTEWTKQSYESATITEFDVQRFISSDTANRNKARELLALFN